MQRFTFLNLCLLLVGAAVVGGAALLVRYHTAYGESIAAEQLSALVAPSVQPTPTQDPAVAFLLGLSAEDVTDYTDPVHGFAFSYPAAFRLSTGTADSEDVVYAEHPSMPLAIEVRVSPMAERTATVEELEAVSDDYNMARPDGVDSTVKAWIDESPVREAPHRGQMWFARQGFLYQVVMEAPDTTWLESWMREFLHEDLSFSHQ